MKHKNQKLAKRRKREGKTNYKKRLRMLLSKKPRLVIRQTNSNMLVQVVTYAPQGDIVVASAHSKELEQFGWKHVKSNIPADYLTGYLLGLKAIASGTKETIVDLGLKSPVKGSRIYACLKGVIDAGVTIPHEKEVLPVAERISGSHISESVSKLFEDVKSNIKVK